MKHFSGKNLFFTLTLAAVLSFSSPANASSFTVGNPVPGGTVLDTCSGCTYIIGQDFGGSAPLSTYTFSAGQAGDITPVLLTYSISGSTVTFKVVGIGTAQSIAGAGTYTFSYGSTAGTALTSVGSAFGFYSVTPVVTFDYFNTATPPSSGGAFFIPSGPLVLGETSTSDVGSGYYMDSLGEPNNRTYAINATAATPEPSSLALLGTGLAGLGGLVKRRLKRA